MPVSTFAVYRCMHYLTLFCLISRAGPQLPALVAGFVGSGNKNCSNYNSREEILAQISGYIRDFINPTLNNFHGPPCSCGDGSKGRWRKIADLDQNSTMEPCPTNWSLIAKESFRGCGNTKPGDCHSAFFQAGATYSKVCGRITAIQSGRPDAFYSHFYNKKGLEESYLRWHFPHTWQPKLKDTHLVS